MLEIKSEYWCFEVIQICYVVGMFEDIYAKLKAKKLNDSQYYFSDRAYEESEEVRWKISQIQQGWFHEKKLNEKELRFYRRRTESIMTEIGVYRGELILIHEKIKRMEELDQIRDCLKRNWLLIEKLSDCIDRFLDILKEFGSIDMVLSRGMKDLLFKSIQQELAQGVRLTRRLS